MFQVSALLVGFLGSFHCVGMCGPIVLAMSGGNQNNSRYLWGRGLYNVGRIFTYALLGIIAGTAGHILLPSGFQQGLSVATGIFMIASVIFMYYYPGKTYTPPFALKLNKLVKQIFKEIIQKRNNASLILAGMANGILPCGFVYLALAGAASTQDPINGAGYMMMFGLGTFPAMMTVAAFGKFASQKLRSGASKLAPVLIIFLGILFIYRGMMIQSHSCCHKNTATISAPAK